MYKKEFYFVNSQVVIEKINKRLGNHGQESWVTERTGIGYIFLMMYPFVPFEFCTINMYYLNVFIKNLKLRDNF